MAKAIVSTPELTDRGHLTEIGRAKMAKTVPEYPSNGKRCRARKTGWISIVKQTEVVCKQSIFLPGFGGLSMPEAPERRSIRQVDKARKTGQEPCGFAPAHERMQTGVELYVDHIFIYVHRNKAHFRLFSRREGAQILICRGDEGTGNREQEWRLPRTYR